VRATTLRSFASTFADAGFDDMAFCPAYGMAEATLAVTLTPPETPWQAVRVPGSGEGQELELAASGPPLPDVRLQAGTDRQPERIAVSSPALLVGYIGPAGPAPVDGWLTTNDCGFVLDGALVVTGRVDDVIAVGGVNIDLAHLDAHLVESGLIRPGAVMVVPTDEGFAVLVEQRSTDPDPAETRQLVSRSLRDRTGIGPRKVVFVEPGALPRTPSGKPRRAAAAALAAEAR
jgi:acyl-CoA synthetase (AMP-forming)/AMP-acid ligase II